MSKIKKVIKLEKIKKEKVKKVIKKKGFLDKLKNHKKKIANVSLTKHEIVNMKKAIKKYKMNLLRNRPISYVLKNLNSKQRLSFAIKSKGNKIKLQSHFQQQEAI